jgi:hypothetical protein
MTSASFQVTSVRGEGVWTNFVVIAKGKKERWHVPAHITARVEGPGYRAEVVTGVDRRTASPTIVRVTVERDPDGPPISEGLRLPVDRILREIVDRSADRFELVDGVWILHSSGVPHASERAITRGTPSETARRVQEEVHFLATRWPEALGHPRPVEWLLDELKRQYGVPKRTAERRWKVAKTKYGINDSGEL